MVFSVGVFNIFECLVTAFIIEVYIYIGEADTVRIEETLKKERVLYRIHIGNPKAVGNSASRSASTAGAHTHTHCSGCGDKVPDNEEVVGITHLADGFEFKIKPFRHFLGKTCGYVL